MAKAAVSRLAQSLLLLLLVSIATFALLRLVPGDPAVLLYGPNGTAQDLAQARERWGLDAPLHLQYLRWLANVVGGDLGRSYVDGRPVAAVIWERVPGTLLLTASALVLACLIGIALGTISAAKRYGWWSRLATIVATALYSIPTFWLGILLILLFSVRLGWLPSGGMRTLGTGGSAFDLLDLLRHLALPALALAMRDAGRIARLTRASLVEVLDQDYLRTAVAKGLTRATIATRHALRNALLPVLALLGMSIPALLSGALVVETVFGWPGMGRLAIESALQRNYPVIMGEVLVVAVLALVGSLMADLACAVADPRIRRDGRG